MPINIPNFNIISREYNLQMVSRTELLNERSANEEIFIRCLPKTQTPRKPGGRRGGREPLEQMITRIVTQAIGQALVPVYQRLDRIEQRLDRVEQRLDKVEQRLDRVEQLMRNHEWIK